MIFYEKDLLEDFENYSIINEEILTNEDYSRNYKTLEEFCEVFKTVENAMYWYKYNNIQWPELKKEEDPNNRPFSWPDDILKTKVGICWDHAIFFYYFCKKHNIPARIYRYAVYIEPLLDDKYWCMGHMVCICKTATGYYVCNYGTKSESNLYGPFQSFEDCAKNYSTWYNNTIIKMIKESQMKTVIKNYTKVYYAYVDKKGLKLYDKYYGRHNISQLEFDKLDTSVRFKYDDKSINRDIFDEFANKATYYIKSFYEKLFGK